MKLWGTIALLFVAVTACAGETEEPGATATTGEWSYPPAATVALAPDKAAKLPPGPSTAATPTSSWSAC